jgi:hypothetical protein
MLVQTFQSAPPVYLLHSEITGFRFGSHYYSHLPYSETLGWIIGVMLGPANTPGGSSLSIYVPHFSGVEYWPGWDLFTWEFDSSSGVFLKRHPFSGLLIPALFAACACRSRLGSMYLGSNWGRFGVLYGFNTIDFSLSDSGIHGDKFVGLQFFQNPSIDEVADVLVDSGLISSRLGVWRLSTGAKLYEVLLPSNLVSSALQGANRIWLLLANRVLILFDYVYQVVLGAVRVPSVGGSRTIGSGEAQVAWDYSLGRILYMEKVPDNPDGSCADTVQGFRSIPVATRLSTPVPVQVARKGQTVQVMVNLLGDMNEPVGGAIVQADVEGAGSLLGIPFTDGYGRSFVKVQCNDAGDVPIACSADIPDYVDY